MHGLTWIEMVNVTWSELETCFWNGLATWNDCCVGNGSLSGYGCETYIIQQQDRPYSESFPKARHRISTNYYIVINHSPRSGTGARTTPRPGTRSGTTTGRSRTAAATTTFILDQSYTPSIQVCSVKFFYSIFHIRIRSEFDNTVLT